MTHFMYRIKLFGYRFIASQPMIGLTVPMMKNTNTARSVCNVPAINLVMGTYNYKRTFRFSLNEIEGGVTTY